MSVTGGKGGSVSEGQWGEMRALGSVRGRW